MTLIVDIWKRRVAQINGEYRKLMDAIHFAENELLKLEMGVTNETNSI